LHILYLYGSCRTSPRTGYATRTFLRFAPHLTRFHWFHAGSHTFCTFLRTHFHALQQVHLFIHSLCTRVYWFCARLPGYGLLSARCLVRLVAVYVRCHAFALIGFTLFVCVLTRFAALIKQHKHISLFGSFLVRMVRVACVCMVHAVLVTIRSLASLVRAVASHCTGYALVKFRLHVPRAVTAFAVYAFTARSAPPGSLRVYAVLFIFYAMHLLPFALHTCTVVSHHVFSGLVPLHTTSLAGCVYCLSASTSHTPFTLFARFWRSAVRSHRISLRFVWFSLYYASPRLFTLLFPLRSPSDSHVVLVRLKFTPMVVAAVRLVLWLRYCGLHLHFLALGLPLFTFTVAVWLPRYLVASHVRFTGLHTFFHGCCLTCGTLVTLRTRLPFRGAVAFGWFTTLTHTYTPLSHGSLPVTPLFTRFYTMVHVLRCVRTPGLLLVLYRGFAFCTHGSGFVFHRRLHRTMRRFGLCLPFANIKRIAVCISLHGFLLPS